MRNRLPFLSALILSAIAVLVFQTQANAQWSNSNQKSKIKQEKRDDKGRTIIVRPSTTFRRVDTYYIDNDSEARSERAYESNNAAALVQLAKLHGYQDGLHEGTKDSRAGKRYDPTGESNYKDADSGYKSRYGSKEQYKQSYRQSFVRGYREAFNRYLGYSERNW